MRVARISKSTSPVRSKPDHQSESTNELLFGESIQVLKNGDLWSEIRSAHDGYEGFVETAAFDFTDQLATHWVSNRTTLVFEHADIKSPVIRRLSFGSQLTLGVNRANHKFFRLANQGFVWAAHCTSKNTPLKMSMVEVVQRHFLNTPYLWGGRSTNGCDCSGLVQMAAMAVGVGLPRDSGDQEAAINLNIAYDHRAAEDLVYWPGHVGVLKSPDLLIHSTAHSLQCCIEPLQKVIERAGSPSSVKRLES